MHKFVSALTMTLLAGAMASPTAHAFPIDPPPPPPHIPTPVYNVRNNTDTEYAFVRANDNHLMVVDPDGTAHDMGRAVRSGSRPSITGTFNNNLITGGDGGWVVAWVDATTGTLWTSANNGNPTDSFQPVALNTSPALVGLVDSTYNLFWVSTNGHLFHLDTQAGTTVDTGRGTWPGTSPTATVTFDPHVYQAVYASDQQGTLITLDRFNNFNQQPLGVQSGTTPVIAHSKAGSQYEIAFNNDGGHQLWRSNESLVGATTGLGMDPTSSPGYADQTPDANQLIGGQFGIGVMVMQSNFHQLWYVDSAALSTAPIGHPVSGATLDPGASPAISWAGTNGYRITWVDGATHKVQLGRLTAATGGTFSKVATSFDAAIGTSTAVTPLWTTTIH